MDDKICSPSKSCSGEGMASDKASKPSPVWSYFDVDDKLEQKAICRICQAKVSFNSNRKSRPNSKEVCIKLLAFLKFYISSVRMNENTSTISFVLGIIK